MKVRLLGDIEVIGDDGRSIELSTQLRRLVAVLAVAGPAGVSAHRLADILFGSDAEGSALRTAVSRLRKNLPAAVETSATGYRLALNSSDVDIVEFEHRVDQAHAAAPRERRSLLRGALAVWRGAALGEFADEEWAVAWVARLDQLRATAVEDLADALLDDGRPEEAVELLEGYLVDHPYRERPVATLMRALGATGRTTEALRTFQRFRLALRDEIGTEPRPSFGDWSRRCSCRMTDRLPSPCGCPSRNAGTIGRTSPARPARSSDAPTRCHV